MVRKLFTLLLSSLTILSCNNNCLDPWHSTPLIHDFYLEWTYKPKTQAITIGSWNCGVGGNEVITDEGIFAVGYDSSFIIAKQHPFKVDNKGESNPDRSTTNYYIIEIKNYPNKWVTNDKVWIYDNLDSFIKAQQQFGVSNKLDFNIVTKELE
jgi:hypothetical protein